MAQRERSAILKLLGIDVWVQRPAAGAAGDAAEPIAVTAAATPQSVPGTIAQREGRASADTQTLRAERSGAQAGTGSAPAVSGEPARQAPSPEKIDTAASSPGPDIGVAQVLSLGCNGMLVLADALGVKAAPRLARDLLLAGSGDWQENVTQTVFTWPPERVSAPGISGRRALLAFADKQLDDLGDSGAVIVCERVLEMLPELVDTLTRKGVRYISAPGLQELMQNGEEKRALWLKIQQLGRP